MKLRERFTGLLVMNTALGTGDAPLTQGFLDWRAWNNRNPDMAVVKLMQRSCPHLSPAEAAAYEAPYPDATYKGGVRRFPNLVPDAPDAPGAATSQRARDFWKNDWEGISMMAIGMTDPVLGPPVMYALQKQIKNCPAPLELSEAGHFVQEWGEPVATAALARF
jgi:haloalkane dehalogenase